MTAALSDGALEFLRVGAIPRDHEVAALVAEVAASRAMLAALRVGVSDVWGGGGGVDEPVQAAVLRECVLRVLDGERGIDEGRGVTPAAQSAVLSRQADR